MNRSSDVDMFISRLSRTCHATFVLAVIDSCGSDPRSAIRGQRMATTESPPVGNIHICKYAKQTTMNIASINVCY